MEWIIAFDLFGVLVFAVSGGLDAAKYRLDILGVMVLAVVTGVGGGLMRDVLLGVHPPAVFTNQIYLLTCIMGGVLVIFFARRIIYIFEWVKIADAIGLGVFSALGAAKAIDYGMGWVGVLMISAMSAAGGGIIRDLILREIPLILRADFYACAAILGGISMLLCSHLVVDEELSLVISAAIAILARLTAIRLGVALPKVSAANDKKL